MPDATDIGGFEGDQTGIGQGLAYVLPQSRSVGYFMQLANEKAQERRDNAAALADQQQKANGQYAQHLYAYKTPDIAKDYTNWLQPKFDGLLDQASQYHAQTGGDPFTNPNFIKQFNDLSAVAKNTHDANVAHTAYATAVADKSKNYTPDSKQAGIDYLNAYQKDPVGNLYTQPPQLVERDLDMNDAVKLGHATTRENTVNGYNVTTADRHNHVVQAQNILSQPEFSPLLANSGINPHVGDIGGMPNGTGGTVYPTDAPNVNAISDHILQNATQPHYAATLQAAGIDPADPHAKDKLTDLVTRQNTGYGKLYSQFADRLDAEVSPKHVRNTADDRLGIAYENLNLREKALADKEAKKASNDNAIEPQDVSQIPYATSAEDSNGGFNINMRNFVPVKSGDVAFGASPDIDLTNGGKPKELSPLSKFKIAGVGDVPLYKNSSGAIQAGTPVRPQDEAIHGLSNYKRMVVLEGEDPADKTKTVNYLMDYNKIPENVKNAKTFKEAISKFEQTPVYGSQPAATQPSATAPKINPQALKGWNQQ